MPWFKVDDGLASKLETTRIPRAHRAAAIGLWALAGSWSARELTDGFIPEHMIDELAGTPESAAWLVSAEFWAEADGGYQFVTWNGEQPMREKVLEQRRKNTEKVQNWRARNAVKPSEPSTDVGNRVTNPVSTEVDNPAPVPNPSRPTSDEVTTPSAPAARELEQDFNRAWANWPKRVERKKSLAAFIKATKTRDVDELVADIIRFGDAYAATTEKRFVPALCVWLNGERWTDELPTGTQRKLTPMQRAEQTVAAGRRVAGMQITSLEPSAAREFPPGHIPSDDEWNAMLADRKPQSTPVPPTTAEIAATQCREHPGYPLINGVCDKCEQIRREEVEAA